MRFKYFIICLMVLVLTGLFNAFQPLQKSMAYVPQNQCSQTTSINAVVNNNISFGGDGVSNGFNTSPSSVSNDGRYVVFVSTSDNLVPRQSDTNLLNDVFLRDQKTQTTTLVSHIPGIATTTGNGNCINPKISADGNFIVFQSKATNLIQDQIDRNVDYDIFLYNRISGDISLVSHSNSSINTTGNVPSVNPSISANGLYVVFESGASNLILGGTDRNASNDIFIYDQSRPTIRLVSHEFGYPYQAGNFHSFEPIISSDITGSTCYIAYKSTSSNLIKGQQDCGNQTVDVFLYNLATEENTLVSHCANDPKVAVGINGFSNLSISGDGRFVVFNRQGNNSVCTTCSGGIVNGYTLPSDGNIQIFLFDRDAPQSEVQVKLVSHASSDPLTPGNGRSYEGFVISGNGQFIAFENGSSNLIPNTTVSPSQIYLYDVNRGDISLVSHASGMATVGAFPSSDSPLIGISFDGRYVTYSSSALNLVSNQIEQNGSVSDVFLYDQLQTDVCLQNSLVSHTFDSAIKTGNSSSNSPVISGDGKHVSFQSNSSDLVRGDTNGKQDVFVTGSTTVNQFYPVASTSGRTIRINGAGFLSGTKVFFGDSRLIPALPADNQMTSNEVRVIVPESKTETGNINGYLTIQTPGSSDITTQNLPQNILNPGDSATTFPEFVLWGDATGDGVFQANDVTLTQAFLQLQAIPTARQMLAVDVVPANPNCSRGNGQLTSTDLSFIRAVSLGQTTFDFSCTLP